MRIDPLQMQRLTIRAVPRISFGRCASLWRHGRCNAFRTLRCLPPSSNCSLPVKVDLVEGQSGLAGQIN